MFETCSESEQQSSSGRHISLTDQLIGYKNPTPIDFFSILKKVVAKNYLMSTRLSGERLKLQAAPSLLATMPSIVTHCIPGRKAHSIFYKVLEVA